MSSTTDILNRPIPGLTGKIVMSLIVLVSTVVGCYIDIKAGIRAGRRERTEILLLVREMREEQKQERKMNDVRTRTQELQINALELKMEFFQKFVEGYKQIK